MFSKPKWYKNTESLVSKLMPKKAEIGEIPKVDGYTFKIETKPKYADIEPIPGSNKFTFQPEGTKPKGFDAGFGKLENINKIQAQDAAKGANNWIEFIDGVNKIGNYFSDVLNPVTDKIQKEYKNHNAKQTRTDMLETVNN